MKLDDRYEIVMRFYLVEDSNNKFTVTRLGY